MQDSKLIYDVCRDLLVDHSDVVPAGLVEVLLGFVRSRAVKGLSTCSDLVDWHILSPHQLALLFQVEALFKKNACFADLERTKEAAMLKFKESELQCRDANTRLEKADDPVYEELLDKMEADIGLLLGNSHSDFQLFLEELPSLVKVTNGASARYPRRESRPHLKFRKSLDCTSRAVPYINALAKYHGFKQQPRLREVNWNRVEVVPKNWKTGRTIACEPEWNTPLQLAFDSFLKRRLRRWNVDLSDQSLNARLAKESSVSGEFATIDLSSASDTLAYNAVFRLLPWEFARYCDDVRSPLYKDESGLHEYNKFSSMGNGSTFTLETLVFTAAVRAVGSKRYAVYGDDIVIEAALAENLIALLSYLGFSVNKEKSFVSGPFRESCGGNYLNGHDVTPFYARNLPKTKSDKCVFVNGLAPWCKEGGRLTTRLLGMIKDNDLPIVPFNYDPRSGVMVDAHTMHKSKALRWRKSTFSHWFKGYVSKTSSDSLEASTIGLLLWHLTYHYKIPKNEASRRSSTVANLDTKYVRKWVCWNPPAEATPAHLYWRSDQISPLMCK
jgi:hypothetical protein